MKITKQDKEKIIQMYKDGMNGAEIARIVPFSHDTVCKVLKDAGFNTLNRLRITKNEIADICKDYENKISTSLILKKHPKIKSQNTILKIVKSQGIKLRGVGKAPILVDDYFKIIDSELKAYFLGFLVTDGSIIIPRTRKRNPTISLTLKDSDRYILEKLKSELKSTNAICHTRNESIFSICSSEMAKDLRTYGIVSNKTGRKPFPILPDEYMPHMIRGIFDGDGCITNKQTCIFYGDTKFVLSIQTWLHTTLSIPVHTITERSNGASGFSFSSKNDVKKFYDYIYKDATVYLIRKKSRFDKLSFITEDANTVVTV